jgi:hypothetical protein
MATKRPDDELSREQFLGRALAAGLAATAVTAEQAVAAAGTHRSLNGGRTDVVRRDLQSTHLEARIPLVRAARTSVHHISIGELRPGPASVGKLVVHNLHLGATTGVVQLKNLHVTVAVALSLEWRVSVSIPIVGSFSWSGTIPLPSLSATIPFGNIQLTGVQSLAIDIASLQADNISALVPSLRNLKLGGLVADRLRAKKIIAPNQGVQLTGLGFGALVLDGLTVPTGSIEAVTVGHVAGGSVPVTSVTLPTITLPETGAGAITSSGIDTSATANRTDFKADASVLTVTLHVTPSARIRMDELSIANLRMSGAIGSIELQDVLVPYELFNVKLSQLGIETLEIPHIEVKQQ